LKILRLSLIFMLLLMAACSRGPENREEDVVAVRKLMQARAEAIANKDIDAYARLIHPEYNDGRNTREMVIEDMRHAFATYDSIAFSYQKAPVELKMNTARVVQRIMYRVNGDKTLHDHEVLILRKSDGRWMISGGITTGLF